MNNSMWWYVTNHEKQGPVTKDELHELLSTESINTQTLVWQQGMAEWIVLAEVEALNDILPVNEPPPIPAQAATPPPIPNSDNVNPVLLANERVLVDSAATNIKTLSASMKLAGRWRRFFARLLDFWITFLIALLPVGIFFEVVSDGDWKATQGAWVLLSVITTGLAFVLDAIIYKLFGNTLGKALLRINVLHANGDKLTFKEYLSRNNLVWGKGFALGIPLLNIVTFLVQFFRIGEGNKASYDQSTDYVVAAKPINWFLLPIFSVLFIVMLGIMSLLNQQFEKASYRATVQYSQQEETNINQAKPSNNDFTPNLEIGIAAYEKKDYELALKHFRPLAEAGNAEAQFSLARIYFLEKNDVSEGVKWLELAAKNEHQEAQYDLSLGLLDSSPKDALFWLEKSANSGHAKAQYMLGLMYEDGKVIEKDYKKAAEWYKKAAEQGNTDAQLALGYMYRDGDGVVKDVQQGIKWYELAATNGNVDAQFLIAISYRNGINGITKDFVRAYHWFNLAASNGHKDSANIMTFLESIMTPNQIAQAQAMTRDFLAKQNKPDEFKALPETKKSESTATTGTAFLVNKQGHLLTNAHVVNQCKTIKVYSENTTTLATIVARDEKNDMAIIKTDVWSYAKPMQFSKQGVGLGQDIYAIGYPLPTLLALDLQMTKGNVSAIAGLGNDSRFYQISAPVQSGNSGGPLVNGYGLVSGMVTSKANLVKVKQLTGDFPQNVNFAIKESQLKNYLDTNRITYDIATSSEELKGEEIASMARKYTVLVECSR